MNLKEIGFIKDKMSITTDWSPVNQTLIDGVKTKEIKNVIKTNGGLTEIWRSSWNLDSLPVDQIFEVSLNPGEHSDWHIHEFTTDRIFVNSGSIKVVLYDPREESSTFGMINEFNLSYRRPMLISIPPKICHAIENISDNVSTLLNIVDIAYNYENPDHWRLPSNSELIPYKFRSERNSKI
jgi:dTDP-4-dehydrorhamnose 3,5-epimerase